MAQHRVLVQLSASEQRLLAMLTARQQCQHLPPLLPASQVELRAWAPMDDPHALPVQGIGRGVPVKVSG